MVTAWCLAEIIRYSHYVTGLQGFKIKPLEWIRYVWVSVFFFVLARDLLSLRKY